MKRALTLKQLIAQKYESLEVHGKWKGAFGELYSDTKICLFGHSGSGKSSFSLQLADYLGGFGKVYYNSIEMGKKSGFMAAVKKLGIENNPNVLVEKENYEECLERMKKRKSPMAVIIDSIDTFKHDDGRKVDFDDYMEFCRILKNKIIVVISQARGKEPKTATGSSIYYYADIKIKVQAWQANVQSRYQGGGEPIIVWEEKYNEILIR